MLIHLYKTYRTTQATRQTLHLGLVQSIKCILSRSVHGGVLGSTRPATMFNTIDYIYILVSLPVDGKDDTHCLL